MTFYTFQLMKKYNNPTIIVITDRNDLDDQLFLTFGQSSDLLRQSQKQANDGDELKELLSVNAGGIVFSTMQKFAPKEGNQMDVLTDRRNVIVKADEAPVTSATPSHTGCNCSKAIAMLTEALYSNDTIEEETYDAVMATLKGGSYNASEKMSKKEIDEMFGFVER